jgi:hypothetical protein
MVREPAGGEARKPAPDHRTSPAAAPLSRGSAARRRRSRIE